jgi:hypothetical protein
MQIKSIGIDLGKTSFHLLALGDRSQVVIRKPWKRLNGRKWQAVLLLHAAVGTATS